MKASEVGQWGLTIANTVMDILHRGGDTYNKLPTEFRESLPSLLGLGLSMADEVLMTHMLYNEIELLERQKVEALIDVMEGFQARYFRYLAVKLFVSTPPGSTKTRKIVVRDAAGNPVLDPKLKIQYEEVEDTTKNANRGVAFLKKIASEIDAANPAAYLDRMVKNQIVSKDSLVQKAMNSFAAVNTAFKKAIQFFGVASPEALVEKINSIIENGAALAGKNAQAGARKFCRWLKKDPYRGFWKEALGFMPKKVWVLILVFLLVLWDSVLNRIF